jgi:hypothetical protein
LKVVPLTWRTVLVTGEITGYASARHTFDALGTQSRQFITTKSMPEIEWQQ